MPQKRCVSSNAKLSQGFIAVGLSGDDCHELITTLFAGLPLMMVVCAQRAAFFGRAFLERHYISH